MTGIDWLIVVGVLLSMLLAALHGFFFELISLAGVVLGYLLAVWGYPRLAPWFQPYVKTNWVADFAAFLVIFVVVVLLADVVGKIARGTMKQAGLQWFDRFLGAVFGLVRGVLVVAIVVLAMASFAPGSRLLASSNLAPYALVIARAAVWVAPSQVRMQFRQGLQDLQKLTPVAGAPNRRTK